MNESESGNCPRILGAKLWSWQPRWPRTAATARCADMMFQRRRAFSFIVFLPDFWLTNIRCGVLARLLAIRCQVLDSERLFVEGLLHDIGHLPLYQVTPEASIRALQTSREEGVSLYRCEQEIIGCS